MGVGWALRVVTVLAGAEDVHTHTHRTHTHTHTDKRDKSAETREREFVDGRWIGVTSGQCACRRRRGCAEAAARP
eukprot:336274-Rhodomonas_salina.1